MVLDLVYVLAVEWLDSRVVCFSRFGICRFLNGLMQWAMVYGLRLELNGACFWFKVFDR